MGKSNRTKFEAFTTFLKSVKDTHDTVAIAFKEAIVGLILSDKQLADGIVKAVERVVAERLAPMQESLAVALDRLNAFLDSVEQPAPSPDPTPEPNPEPTPAPDPSPKPKSEQLATRIDSRDKTTSTSKTTNTLKVITAKDVTWMCTEVCNQLGRNDIDPNGLYQKILEFPRKDWAGLFHRIYRQYWKREIIYKLYAHACMSEEEQEQFYPNCANLAWDVIKGNLTEEQAIDEIIDIYTLSSIASATQPADEAPPAPSPAKSAPETAIPLAESFIIEKDDNRPHKGKKQASRRRR